MKINQRDALTEAELRRTVEVWESCGRNNMATGEVLGMSATAIRKRLKKARKAGITDFVAQAENHSGRVFIVTSCQNETPVFKRFWDNLLAYAKHRDAEVIVGAFSYAKNLWQPSDPDTSLYYPEVEPYIVREKKMIAPGLMFLGDLNILPTAVVPTAGLEGVEGNTDLIVPHSKVAIQSVATMLNAKAKVIITTGCVSESNYRNARAGYKANHHHSYSALVVEVDSDGVYFIRHISADGAGSFYDLDLFVQHGEVTAGNTLEAVNWGDIHLAKMAPWVEDVCWLRDGNVIDVMKPTFQFMHDLFDGQARNGHERDDPQYRERMACFGTGTVRLEVRDAAKWLEGVAHRDFCQTIVVESNHDTQLARWLKDRKVYDDHENAEYWHWLNFAKYQALHTAKKFNAFEFAARDESATRLDGVEFLAYGSSFKICQASTAPIECALHGDIGANGARGSIQGLSRMPEKINIGHSHSPGVRDGAWMAGCSNLMHGYNEFGPSAWSIAMIFTYPNAKRAMIFPVKGRWRGGMD